MDLNGPTYEDTYDTLYSRELVHQIRQYLRTVPLRNGQDQCDLPLFFEAVLRQAYGEGRVDTIALSEEFNVSRTSIQNWLKRLRGEIAKVVGVL
jgi:hypothetical protein